jgi:hypothetical protein
MGWEERCEVLGDTNWTDVVVSVSKIFDIIKDIPHAWSPSTVRTEIWHQQSVSIAEI